MISILKRNSCGKVSLLKLHYANFFQKCLTYIVVIAATSKDTQFLFSVPANCTWMQRYVGWKWYCRWVPCDKTRYESRGSEYLWRNSWHTRPHRGKSHNRAASILPVNHPKRLCIFYSRNIFRRWLVSSSSIQYLSIPLESKLGIFVYIFGPLPL